MSEIDSGGAPFRELRGDYVDHAGQQINLQGYLDYFEPLGSSLSRLPDGAGGPFVYRFSAGGGRTIGALGWVVSAAARRYGAWKMWGLWTDRAMPAIALPLFWPDLADPSHVSDVVASANRDADRLFTRSRWPALCGQIDRGRIRNRDFREILKAELSHAWAAPPPHRQPIEIELTAPMLDLLPWLYILGPVDPGEAQLQPSRFNGGGYQYILIDRDAPLRDAEIPSEIDDIVDAAADDVVRGWRNAEGLRARRARPAPAPRPAPPPRREPDRWQEEDEMPSRKPPKPRVTLPLETWKAVWTTLYQIASLGLLFWIALEVRGIRNAMPQKPGAAPPPVSATTTAAEYAPVPQPVEAPETPAARVARIAQTLAARPPQGIRVDPAAIVDAPSLARAAVEVVLRRNGCVKGSEAVDGKLSAAEQRAMRTCRALSSERLVNARGEIDAPRAIDWLERALS
jgi:hypothetical protein